MRVKLPIPKVGDKRTKNWFAIFPVFVHREGREIRWFERVTVKQKYCTCLSMGPCGEIGFKDQWVNSEFV